MKIYNKNNIIMEMILNFFLIFVYGNIESKAAYFKLWLLGILIMICPAFRIFYLQNIYNENIKQPTAAICKLFITYTILKR